MESCRFYLLSQQNKIGAAVYLDARDDADALVKAPATSLYPKTFRPSRFGKESAWSVA